MAWVDFAPSWLENLVQCTADETGAWSSWPSLYLEGSQKANYPHLGGRANFTPAARQSEEVMQKAMFRGSHAGSAQLQPGATELIEGIPFARLWTVGVFEKQAPWMKKLMGSPEHIDLCLTIAGGLVAQFTLNLVHLRHPPRCMDRSTLLLWWSDVWNRMTLNTFKWNGI